MIKRIVTEITILLFITFFGGCLKDAPTVPVNPKTGNSPVLLGYLEEHGNYINSPFMPSLVDAPEVYNNITTYLILDVRTPQDFASGHIQNSVNVKPDSLLIYLKSINADSYPKIIIVSSTGQAASYYSCLLILDGYTNVYAMRFGMASWNSSFSDPWLSALDNLVPRTLTDTDYPKDGYSPLPSLTFPDENADAKSKLEYRINQLLAAGFEDEIKIEYSTPAIDIRIILPVDKARGYLICLGDPQFYKSYFGTSHPFDAILYLFAAPNLEFESTNLLQTLPSNKTIYLYSYAGNISAFITAYLRVLGYDARSVLYGGNNMIYNAMRNTPSIVQYTFSSGDIYNFGYVTGN